MENKLPDFSQPEIEAPDEKLLRPPTFEEKYGWVNKALLLILVVMIINLGIYFVIQWSTVPPAQSPQMIPPPTSLPITTVPTHAPLSPTPSPALTTCTADAKQCPDGSLVGRSGPNCEFVCPE